MTLRKHLKLMRTVFIIHKHSKTQHPSRLNQNNLHSKQHTSSETLVTEKKTRLEIVVQVN